MESKDDTLSKSKEYLKEHPDDDRAWFEYGKALWKAGMRPAAETAYRRAVELNPRSDARIALELSEDISSFFNPDLLNP